MGEFPGDIYSNLNFPTAADDLPYCFIDMVTTIDGKILSGKRDEHVLDLGSKTDHMLMKRIEGQADGVLVGAQTLRTTLAKWSPASRARIVVSASGNLPYESQFFDGENTFVATSESSTLQPNGRARLLKAGQNTVDFRKLFHRLRNELGIQTLLVLGGSELNAQLLAANLVDELFVTIAPKVKLGRDVPTYADGDPLPRESLQRYNLIEHHVIGDEIFIRYRRDQFADNPITG